MKPVNGYYVSTDLLYRFGEQYLWSSGSEYEEQTVFRFEHYYWDADHETWHGDVSKATLYKSVEEAEGALFFAVIRDPNTAGHVHVVQEMPAIAREHSRIIARNEIQKKQMDHGRGDYQLPPTPPPEH